MRQEIKDRINFIMRGKIPNGYKRTDAGIIPHDWDDTFLGQRMRVFRGSSPRPKGDPKYYGGKIPRLMIQDVTRDGKYTYPCIDSLTEEGAKKSRLLPKGSVVLSCSGTKVGIPGIIGIDACIHDGFFGFDSFKKINSEYLYYFFGLLNIKLQSSATRGGVFNNLTTDIMKELPVGLPNENEQQKIAIILSTWDKAIELKEQKRGLMNKLLTGEVRLPGFEGEWKEVRLSDVCDLIHGYQFRKEDFTSSGIPIIKIGNVKGYNLDMSDISYVSEDRINEFSNIIIKNGDLLMSLTGNIGRVVEVTDLHGPVFQNYRVGKFISCSDKLTKQYLKHLLSSDLLFNQFNGLANQSAQANFGKQDMNKLSFEMPKDEKEQIKIAQILNYSIKEILLHEKDLAALKLQKKGLMQLLLTGIVRTIHN